MNPIQQEKPTKQTRQKEYRRLNLVEVDSNSATSLSATSNYNWTCPNAKVQKVGGGGCISGAFRTAPR